MKNTKRITLLAACAAMLCATGLATAGPASASQESAVNCDKAIWDSCLTLYYNSSQKGSHTAFFGSDGNFSDNKFLSSGAGQGQVVKNNAASANVWGIPPYYPEFAVIYYNSNYAGSCDAISVNWYTDRLHNTYNENASWQIAGNPNVWAGCYIFS